MRLTASSSAKRKSGPIEKGSLPTVPIQEVLAQCLPTFFDACAHSGTFDCSPIELSFLPYGTFVPPLWNFHSSPMELSFLPYGTFIPSLWNFHSSPMELSFLLYGIFIPPLWNFCSSPMELLFLSCQVRRLVLTASGTMVFIDDNILVNKSGTRIIC